MGSTKMNNGIMFHRYLFSLHPTFCAPMQASPLIFTLSMLLIQKIFYRVIMLVAVVRLSVCLVALRFLITFGRKRRSLCLEAGLGSEVADTLTSKAARPA